MAPARLEQDSDRGGRAGEHGEDGGGGGGGGGVGQGADCGGRAWEHGEDGGAGGERSVVTIAGDSVRCLQCLELCLPQLSTLVVVHRLK